MSKQAVHVFEGVLHSMVTFAELEIGGEDVSEVLDKYQDKIVRLTIEPQ